MLQKFKMLFIDRRDFSFTPKEKTQVMKYGCMNGVITSAACLIAILSHRI